MRLYLVCGVGVNIKPPDYVTTDKDKAIKVAHSLGVTYDDDGWHDISVYELEVDKMYNEEEIPCVFTISRPERIAALKQLGKYKYDLPPYKNVSS